MSEPRNVNDEHETAASVDQAAADSAVDEQAGDAGEAELAVAVDDASADDAADSLPPADADEPGEADDDDADDDAPADDTGVVSDWLVQIIEAALLAAGRPLTLAQIGALFEDHERPSKADLRACVDEVAARCEGRGFELVEVASGYRFQVRESLSTWIGRLWQERPQRYSRALLETLALIAYRQPITRGEIEEIRGVAVSSNIIKTLQERDWIRVVGHRDVPGRPAMYATTRQFLDYFNLKSLDQLPALADIRDLETLNAELGFSDPVPETTEPAPAAPENEAEDHGQTR